MLLEFDTLHEIFETMKQNKLRTFLTGFSVAWGIFILIVLIGSGNGLQNGVRSNFDEYAVNMVSVWPRRTSMPYKGFKAYRSLSLRDSDIETLRRSFPKIDKISGSLRQWGSNISYGKEYGSYLIEGVMPDYLYINFLKIEAGNGRFINDIDIRQERKVCVIQQKIAENLFRDTSPLGKYLSINGILFQVVGIDTKASDSENSTCFIPYSTYQTVYNRRGFTDEINFTVQGLEKAKDNEAFSKEVRQVLAKELMVHPEDERAIGVWTMAENYVQTMSIFSTLRLFILIVGICTLIAGVVGVSNIMIITVKERTKEFGIKKAIGAKPSHILKSVLVESSFITAVFGYIGMLLGIGVLELINLIFSQQNGGSSSDAFKNPSVDIQTLLFATLILILAGLIAGYFPARKAVHIKPIEAMRAD